MSSLRVRMTPTPRKSRIRGFLVGFPLIAAAILTLHIVSVDRKGLIPSPASVSSTANALKNSFSNSLQQHPPAPVPPPASAAAQNPPTGSVVAPPIALVDVGSQPTAAAPPVTPANVGTKPAVPPAAPAAPEPEVDFGPLPKCALEGKAQTWLMVFMGHSGSSAMISQLRHDGTYIKDPEPVDHHEYEFNHTLALKYVREHFQAGIREGRSAGFKIRPLHITAQPRLWAELALKYKTRIIWNYRGNMFKQAVGEYKYLKLNDFTVIEGLREKVNMTERCKYTKCGFRIDDYEFLHKQLTRFAVLDRWIMEAVDKIDNGRGCVMPLPYEKYLYHPEATMKRIHQFLGLQYKQVPTTRFKSTSDNMCKEISNWNDVCTNFYSCLTWRSMMQDPRNNCDCPVTHRKSSEKYCNVYPKEQ